MNEFRSNLRPRAAFTLIELLVVIGIIIVLVGLTVTVAVGLTAGNDKRDAELLMTHLNTALQEWETAAGRQLTYGLNTDRTKFDFSEVLYTVPNGADKLHTDFFKVILRNQQAADQIAKIGKDRVKRDAAGNPVIVDPWDQKIQILFPGRKFGLLPVDFGTVADADKKDLDGTIRTKSEEQYGICSEARIAFVSFGPNQQPGSLQLAIPPASRQKRQLEFAADNVTSYPLLPERPKPWP